MQIKVSSKGQVVLPLAARKKYQIQAGDTVQLVMKEDQMTLIPKKQKKRKWRMIKDSVTGRESVTFGPDAPIITHSEIRKLLEDFP